MRERLSFLPMGNPVSAGKAKSCGDVNLAQAGLFAVEAEHVGDRLFCGHGEDDDTLIKWHG